MAIMKATDTIPVAVEYDGMRIFLAAVCQRLGKTSSEIDFILGGMKWADGTTVDPAMWRDWLAAVEMVRRGIVP